MRKDWFRKRLDRRGGHPAFERWVCCNEVLTRDGRLSFPRDESLFIAFGRTVLDNLTLLLCSGGTLSNFNLGDLANHGDENVQKRLKADLQNPTQFSDMLTELSFAAWHISRGHHVTAHQCEGFPDFEIILPDLHLPITVDCKRLRKESARRRVADVLCKANQQIKRLGKACWGMAVLDVCDKVQSVRRTPDLSDDLPPEVIEIQRDVRRALVNRNRSISGVLLMWDDLILLYADRRVNAVMLYVRKHSLLIPHQESYSPLHASIAGLKVGFTFNLNIDVT